MSDNCNKCGNSVVICTCPNPEYTEQGCTDSTNFECVFYRGNDLPCLNFDKDSSLEDLLNILEAFKCAYDNNTENESTWEGSSETLVITQGGTNGHAPIIELVPSTVLNNLLYIDESDDHPAVILNADNGLYKNTDNNIRLGGSLVESTDIETDEINTLSITGLTELDDESNPDFILTETTAGVIQRIPPDDLFKIFETEQIVYTADNGLSKDTATNVQLGGTLIKDTQVDTGDYDLLISKTVGDRTGLEIWTGLPNQVAKVTIISDISEDLVNIEEVRNGLIQLEISDLTDRNNADPGALDQGYYSKGIISVTDTYAKLAYHTPQKVDVGNAPVFDDVNTARIIAEAGLIDITATLTQVSNNISIGNKVLVAEAANKSVGTATLNNGTVTVANTSVTANSRIFLSREAINGSTTLGELTYTKIANTSFTINSVQTTTPASLETGDDSIINYLIIN